MQDSKLRFAMQLLQNTVVLLGLHIALDCSCEQNIQCCAVRAAALCHKSKLLTWLLVLDVQAESSDPLEKFCDDNPDADECRWVLLLFAL